MNIVIAILIFSLIIVIHELGHFLLAKKNGIVVTEFSIGMGPKVISYKKGETRYSIKLLPFGGSCMMLGEDEDVLVEGSFNSKGVWQRISVVIAGPFFNFILAFILAVIVISSVGIDLPKVRQVENGTPIEIAGIKEGDIIKKIGKTNVNISRDLEFFFQFNTLTEKPINISYIRDNKTYKTSVTPYKTEKYLLGFTYTPENAEVLSLLEGYPFDLAGIKIGDLITKINDVSISLGSDISDYIRENPLSEEEINITFVRKGKEESVKVKPKEHIEYSIGLNYNLERTKASILGIIKYSFNEVKFWIVNTVRSVGYLISGKISAKQIAGPVGVVKAMDDIYEGTKDYGLVILMLELINFSLLLSANLGVMNLLPIPALDGGRLVFLILEALRGKPIDREKEGIVHLIGIIALMVLMAFVLYNDIRNIF